jgi:membrane associated rhomboid family serine protease
MTILRALSNQRGYVALSVLTLALAVGANVVVFTIVNALWVRPRRARARTRLRRQRR